jgi:thioredoxin-like negative regulator of GroEL
MMMITFNELIQKFQQHNRVVVFIGGTNCSVCEALYPRVQQALKEFPTLTLLHANAHEEKEIAGQFQVFTVPAILYIYRGREIKRQARFIPDEELENALNQLQQIGMSYFQNEEVR